MHEDIHIRFGPVYVSSLYMFVEAQRQVSGRSSKNFQVLSMKIHDTISGHGVPFEPTTKRLWPIELKSSAETTGSCALESLEYGFILR